jgi:hypothetical protein
VDGVGPVPDTTTEEVRVAMALNGGVSLAVWMGGCAVELDCARRAHLAREEPMFVEGVSAYPVPPRRLYAGLCRAFGREIVLDVMSGASAGGINGALLSAAMTRGRRLHPDLVRRRWLELGDLLRLLHPLSEPRPLDLLNGAGFTRHLEETFRAMLEPDGADGALGSAPVAAPVQVPLLDVTTTDLSGAERSFRDLWDLEVRAREHRACFRFRELGDYSLENLVAASRSSASFPVAFAPFEVRDPDARRLAGFDTPRWVIDGGLLDNAPIAAALRLIPVRAATRQVRRFLCYVNPDPAEASAPAPAGAPDLKRVLGAMVNLPRKAPFAGQLEAVQTVFRRSAITQAAELGLLQLDLDVLEATAGALLLSYRRRRRLRSLHDLLDQPGDVKLVFERLGDALELPWIPTALGAPPRGEWGWGILAARRIHHLMLDLLRLSLPAQGEDARATLLKARIGIDARLAAVEDERAALTERSGVRAVLADMAAEGQDDVSAEVGSLKALMADFDGPLREGVWLTALEVFRAAVQIGAPQEVPVGLALFGDEWLTSDTLTRGMWEHFLRRVLAIEVVRRAFAAGDEVEDGQEVGFVQLTPFAPDLIFSKRPLSRPREASPARKLTGTIIGHFGGFYRSSWRANDFMWGRLDAAVGVVAMVVDPERARRLADQGRAVEQEPWAILADTLLPAESTAEQVWLVRETLEDAGVELAGGDDGVDRLRAELSELLRADLATGGSKGTLTRALCTRAAQLEIVRHELPVLVDQAAADRKSGSSAAELGLPSSATLRSGEGLREAIESLRAEPPLPIRLGRESDEELTSDLAVRSIARAGLVSLGVVREGRIPLAQPGQLLRSFFLPLAGSVARSPWSRLALTLAYWAAALFLAARVATLAPGAPADLRDLTLLELIVSLIALLVVLGTAGLPLYRALKREGGSRLPQVGWVLVLLGAGVGFAVARALAAGVDIEQLIVAAGATPCPTERMWLPTGVALGASVVRVPRVSRVLDGLVAPAWRGGLSVALVVLSAAAIGLWAQGPLRDAAAEGGWEALVAWVALAGAPAAAFAYLLLRPGLARLLRPFRAGP